MKTKLNVLLSLESCLESQNGSTTTPHPGTFDHTHQFRMGRKKQPKTFADPKFPCFLGNFQINQASFESIEKPM